MLRKSQVGYATALMVARHHIHRYATVSHALERLEGLPYHATRRSRTVVHVSAVHDEINFTRQRRVQRGGKVGQKFVSTSPSIDARVDRQVETEVRIR